MLGQKEAKKPLENIRSLLFDVMCRSDLLKENGVVFLEEKELGWVDIRPNSEPNNIGPKA